MTRGGVDEAFTGLWARDHSSMLQQLRSTFAKLRGFEAERAAIKMLTAVMVKQHERVCEHFAKGRPSLNAQARSEMATDARGQPPGTLPAVAGLAMLRSAPYSPTQILMVSGRSRGNTAMFVSVDSRD
ncbi:hypothetical protein ACVIWV_006445 [Bradyrhizobium diazoefficiens]